MIAWACFWLGLGALLHLYALYPSSLWLLARLRPRPVREGPVEPTLALVIPAYNEADCIAAKLGNSLGLDYPPERLQVLVASDGSTDGTDDIVRREAERIGGGRIRLLSLPRRGKAHALNAAAAATDADVLVFTDANSELAADALRSLVAPFADPEVGGVCGAKRYRPSSGDATQVGEGIYWRLDQWQKRMETASGSIFAADGTLHAVRRELYVPLENAAQADDIAISARVVLQGRRLVFAPGAVAFEDAPGSGGDELWRKVRVTNHSLRALLGLGSGLWTRGLYSYKVLSHKLLRHLSPLFAGMLGVSSALLAGRSPLAAAVLAAGCLVLLLAGLGALGRRHGWGSSRLLTVPYYFALVNLAALLGIATVVLGVRRARWAPRGGLMRGENTP